ncbi:Retrovirus-related Pol polyprotein from transposon, partial [Toxocara canis]
MSNGSIKAVAHASRALTPAEQNHSQIEKEGLAVTFAVMKSHKIFFGRHFTLLTDHRRLLGIFGSKKGVPKHYKTSSPLSNPLSYVPMTSRSNTERHQTLDKLILSRV